VRVKRPSECFASVRKTSASDTSSCWQSVITSSSKGQHSNTLLTPSAASSIVYRIAERNDDVEIQDSWQQTQFIKNNEALTPSVPSVAARTTRPLSTTAFKPRTKAGRTLTVFASSAFSVAAPTVWNSMPLQTMSSTWTPQQLLKKVIQNSPFPLRHVKRSCHRSTSALLINGAIKVLSFIYSFIQSISDKLSAWLCSSIIYTPFSAKIKIHYLNS